MTPPPAEPEQHVMSFGDHLEELRWRILMALALPIPVSVITFFFSDTLIRWLVLPLSKALTYHGLPMKIQALSPPEVLLAQIKLSLISALIISAPWLLWQAWLFISPGLFKQERRFVYLLLPGSAILTTLGVALMYFVMLPIMLLVLVGFGSGLTIADDRPPLDPRIQTLLATQDDITIRFEMPQDPPAGELWLQWPDMRLYATVVAEARDVPNSLFGEPDVAIGDVIRLEVPRPAGPLVTQEYHISKYIGFVLLLFLGIVIAFQMPLVVLLLGWLGLASPAWLAKQRKYALLVCGVVSAVITPADVISMLVMLAPLYGLYELGILLLRIAPASKVAEGRVFHWSRPGRKKDPAGRPDKANDDAMQTTEMTQPEETIARTEPRQQSPDDQSDGESNG